MTGSPLDVLRVFMEDALLDLPREDYQPEWDAITQVETLVATVDHVLRNGEQGKQSRRRLKESLAPFVSGSGGEPA